MKQFSRGVGTHTRRQSQKRRNGKRSSRADPTLGKPVRECHRARPPSPLKGAQPSCSHTLFPLLPTHAGELEPLKRPACEEDLTPPSTTPPLKSPTPAPLCPCARSPLEAICKRIRKLPESSRESDLELNVLRGTVKQHLNQQTVKIQSEGMPR